LGAILRADLEEGVEVKGESFPDTTRPGPIAPTRSCGSGTV